MATTRADPAEQAFRALRGAVYSGDGARALTALADVPEAEALQYAGDAALLALVQRVEGSRAAAESCALALINRDEEGDAELADELQAALGRKPTALLRSIGVDLDELSEQLEGGPLHTGGRVDLRTGEVYPASLFEDPAAWADLANELLDDADDEDPDRWLQVDSLGSRAGYDDMVQFRNAIDDERLGALLDVALAGRGAFRRFKDVLADAPGELDRWFRFADDRCRGRARAWLAERGYRPAVPTEPRPA